MIEGTTKFVTVIACTTPRGSMRQKPAEGAESRKVLTDKLLNNPFFNLFIKEYSDGKEIDNAFDLIFANQYTKGNKIILEIIPHIEDDKLLRLFTYFPGFESFSPKLSSENTHFKNAFFEKVDVKNQVIYGLSAEPQYNVIVFKY